MSSARLNPVGRANVQQERERIAEATTCPFESVVSAEPDADPWPQILTRQPAHDDPDVAAFDEDL